MKNDSAGVGCRSPIDNGKERAPKQNFYAPKFADELLSPNTERVSGRQAHSVGSEKEGTRLSVCLSVCPSMDL